MEEESSHDESLSSLSHDEASHSDTADEQEQQNTDQDRSTGEISSHEPHHGPQHHHDDSFHGPHHEPQHYDENDHSFELPLKWLLHAQSNNSLEGHYMDKVEKILKLGADGIRENSDMLNKLFLRLSRMRLNRFEELDNWHTNLVEDEDQRLDEKRQYELVASKAFLEDDQQLENDSQESYKDTEMPYKQQDEQLDDPIPPGDRNGNKGAKSKSLKKRKRQQNTASDYESSDSESDDDDDDESDTQPRKRPKAKASSKQVVPSTTSLQKQEEAKAKEDEAKRSQEQAQVAIQQSDAKYTNQIATFEAINKDTLPQAQQQLVVGTVDLLIRLPFLLDAIMDPSQSVLGLDSLLSVATSSIRVIIPQIKAFNVVSSATAKKANNLARVFDNDASFGSILHACDSQLQDVDESMAGEIRRLKLALYQFMNPEVNDTTDVDLDKEVSDRQLMKFVKLGYPTRNIIQHLSNLVVVLSLIKELKLSAAVAHLSPKKAEDLIRRAKELAEIVNPRATLDIDNITVLSYLTQYINPGLGMADWELAAALLFALFNSISGCSSCFHRAQAVTVSGRRDEKGIDFFGGNQRIHRGRRTRACRSFALLILKEAIKRRLPHGLFSNYTHSILLLSPTEIASHLYFVKENFFDSKHGEDSDEVKRTRESVLKKESSNDGEVSLLLDNREQVVCLKQLFNMSRQLRK